MAYDFLIAGTQRFDRQGFVGPTNSDYAIRIYHVSAVGSLNNAQVVLSRVTSGSTATDVTTSMITLPLNDSGTNVTGEWSNAYGRLVDTGAVLLNTSAAFSYAVVEYIVLKK